MTPNEARDELWRGLGFRQDRESTLFYELNQAQIRLEEDEKLEHPWFLLDRYSMGDTVAGTQAMALPINFLQLDDDEAPEYYDTDAAIWLPLVVDQPDILKLNYPGEGSPQAVAIRGLFMEVYPIPDAAYTIRASMFRRGGPIQKDGPETAWLYWAGAAVIAEAGVRMAGDLRDVNALQNFTTRKQEAMTALMRKINARKLAGTRPVMGGDD